MFGSDAPLKTAFFSIMNKTSYKKTYIQCFKRELVVFVDKNSI